MAGRVFASRWWMSTATRDGQWRFAYRTVIFDIDGTLIDSNNAHALAWVKALREHGFLVGFAQVRWLIGMGGDKLLPMLTDLDSESEEGRAISDRRRRIFMHEYLPALHPTHGALALVQRLHKEGLTLVVATSAEREEVKGLLDMAGVAHLFDRAASSDDAGRSKPDPDIVRAALRQCGSQASDAIMIGDTPYDVRAAAQAGVGLIALRSGGWWVDEKLAGAMAIYDSPAHLLARIAHSPFQRRSTPSREPRDPGPSAIQT
jgi:HAD superfamily hydrolase (TIGR01509 family)